MSMAMIEQAKSCGVTAILTTPHIRGRESDLPLHAHHKERFQLVLDEKPSIPVHLGGEVRVTSETHQVISHKEFTASEQSKYILLELDFNEVPTYFSKLLFEYRLAGITPIIAHPERNLGVMRNMEHALDFVRQGAHLQVTTTSFIGELGESIEACALALVEAGLVTIFASDAHNINTRPYTSWPAAYERAKEIEEQTKNFTRPIIANAICHDNPLAVVEGRPLAPIDLDEPTMNTIRKRLSGTARASAGIPKRKRFFFV